MEGTIGVIIPWAPNFAPRNWAFCDGQLLPIASFTALFSILGTTYGGDGRTTFALPDLRGRVAVQPGHGPGLSNYVLGQRLGVESVTLMENELPAHEHSQISSPGVEVNATTAGGNQALPSPSHRIAAGRLSFGVQVDQFSSASPNTQIGGLSISGVSDTEITGGGQPHENRQPYLALNYIICLQGIFPSRN
jgi:microcystin-dependent protein